MDKIIRCITSDGSLMASAIDSSDLVFTAQELHKLTKTTAAALGRLLTGASIMGAMLKSSKANLTLKVNGGGAIDNLIARADAKGNVRGYVDHPEVDLEIRADGKIDVGKAVGKDGKFAVIRDEGSGEPYMGFIELVSGEIAEDITAYYAQSEQIPSVCALGVLVDQEDGKVILAGGMLIQVLPGADEECITKLEKNIQEMDSATTMLAKGMTPLEMCETALAGFEVEVLDTFDVNYVCNCSKERFSEILTTIGADDVRDIPLVKDGKAEMVCQYCSRHYYFSKEELDKIADSMQ
jgi:Disulfide bond chaperones of the HSP33 family